MPLEVREALNTDNLRISQIAAETFALACPPDTPGSEIDAFIQENLLPQHFEELLDDDDKQLRVILREGEVIGYSLVSYRPDTLGVAQADNVPELTRCYLSASHHGTGAAQFLLNSTLRCIEGPIRLTVSEANERAIRFYRRNGFETVGETTFQCGADLHRDWVMLRK
ncbi:GNAT family N-acetyltransferase [Pseudomonas sp. H11T01]|uniref:GNAT family N-acetyltransferase n=1 Tax=Pseudomonas sp. H11T01 TaxID=3402749 RepID=UPI003AD76A37